MSFRKYYDSSSYSRNRDGSKPSTSSTTERPTALTTKYSTTSFQKSSSIPVPSDRNSREETPISAIANRYASYSKNNTEKLTSLKYDKKDYTKLSVPSVTSSKTREVNPVSSILRVSKYKRQASPDRKSTKNFKNKDIGPTDLEKDIPIKTDKATGYSSLSNYKIYPRPSSYTRPVSRTDSKPEISYNRPVSRTENKPEMNYSPSTRTEKQELSHRASMRTETKPEITVNRCAIANRLSSSSYLRSPTPIKRPTLSPITHTDSIKSDPEIVVTRIISIEENSDTNNEKDVQSNIELPTKDEDLETVTVVTRHTSPTPPGSSSYVRSRRADLAKTIEKIVTRKKVRPLCYNKEIQSDRLDDPTRSSRFASSTRSSVTNWTYYSPNVPSYTGYAGRYSTQYSNLRDNSYTERCSRSRSKEPQIPEDHASNTPLEKITNDASYDENNTSNTNNSQDTVNVYEKDKDEETSEIIINVNFKLKKAKSPSAVSVTELISPEITIMNSQLPPQPPKNETTIKNKKIKQRKSSTDSSSDSNSTKKLIKKRSKSVSSSDSDHASDKNTTNNINKLIKLKKSKSNNKVQNGVSDSKKTKNSCLESSISLTSSISEDDNIYKMKTADLISTVGIQNSCTIQQKLDTGTEEAKSFLIRALAPVTNLFKLRNQESNENSRCIDQSNSDSTIKDVCENSSTKNKCSTNNVIASNEDSLVKLKAVRRIESGERSWWLESDNNSKNINEENENSRYIDGCSQNKAETQINLRKSESNDSDSSKKYLYIDEEKPWWLDSSANIPEGIERLTPSRKSSSEEDRREKLSISKVVHNESGEQYDWRNSNNENSKNCKTDLQGNIKLSKSGSDQRVFALRRIRHIESGERPWWLSSDKNIPEGIEKLPTPPPQEESDSSDSEEVEVYIPSSQIPPFPLNLPDDEPLGDRRSPEGLENPNVLEIYANRHSPYENNQYRQNLSYTKRAKYISRYTDIDDILATSNHIYRPFMDSKLSKSHDSYDDDEECEEIDPTQVRIHDSTPQMPVIRKLHSRSDLIDYENEDQPLN